MFLKLRCQRFQCRLQLQLLLHLSMTVRVKFAIGNHNSQRSRFTATATPVHGRQFGQQLIARTQRVRHQIPVPFRRHTAPLAARHFRHLQRQRKPLVPIDRNLLFQTDQRQIILSHRPQLQNIVRRQQQRRLLLIDKTGARNQVGLRSNLVPRTKHILKSRLLRNQMDPIRPRILNRNRSRPQTTGRPLIRTALLCHRQQRNHHRCVRIQRVQTQLGR